MEKIIRPQSPPALKEFISLAKEPCNDIRIIAPFITATGVRHLVQALQNRNLKNDFNVLDFAFE